MIQGDSKNKYFFNFLIFFVRLGGEEGVENERVSFPCLKGGFNKLKFGFKRSAIEMIAAAPQNWGIDPGNLTV